MQKRPLITPIETFLARVCKSHTRWRNAFLTKRRTTQTNISREGRAINKNPRKIESTPQL
jgi:hypothetical protein